MKPEEQLFLEALKASLNNTTVTWTTALTNEEWQSLFALAESHKVLPLIFDAVYSCPAAVAAEGQLFAAIKRRTLTLTLNQVQKTAEFLSLYQKFQKVGVTPIVVKGLICREIYPKPDLRISSDEDLLTTDEDFVKAIEVLKSCDMKPREADAIDETAEEIGFIAEKGLSYIELHRRLFSEKSEAYGDLNRYFDDCFEHKICINVQGTDIYTLEPTNNLFYLICHALKHFLHSGFGLRQVCDIVMFANAYGSEIDWQKLLVQCLEIRAEKFVAALFKIGKNYLTFDEEKSCYPEAWRAIQVEETMLLEELLGSGIYGDSSMSRKHSSGMTLDAVAAWKKGRTQGNVVLNSAFPSAKALQGRYPYLKDKPYLLPVAWINRMITYHKETKVMKNNTAAEAVMIGKQRITLLKMYGIIE